MSDTDNSLGAMPVLTIGTPEEAAAEPSPAEMRLPPEEMILPQDEMTPITAVAAEFPAAAELPPLPSIVTASSAPSSTGFDINAIEIEHAQWLSTEGKEGKRANFRGLDLSGVDISGRHLMEASFRSANLHHANLSGTDLRGADLSEAVLDNANMTGAFLYGASFARAQLHQVEAANADLTTANFTAAIAENINLNGAKMGGAILRDANFRHANFTHVLLRDANLRGATLVEANLRYADLSAADCRDVNFDRSQFAGAVLDNTNFRGAKLGGIDMQAADFSVAQDVSTEFQAQSLQSERTKIQEEQAQLASRERVLAQEKERIDTALSEMHAAQAQYERRLRSVSRVFTICFVFWLLIAALLVALVADRFGDIDITRVMAILGGVGFVFLLSLFSMLFSFKAAGIAKKMMAVAPPSLGDTSYDNASSPMPAEPALFPTSTPSQASESDIAPALKKPAGFGFGKKKPTNF